LGDTKSAQKVTEKQKGQSNSIPAKEAGKSETPAPLKPTLKAPEPTKAKETPKPKPNQIGSETVEVTTPKERTNKLQAMRALAMSGEPASAELLSTLSLPSDNSRFSITFPPLSIVCLCFKSHSISKGI
jgi:hypothetical protein